MGDTSADGENIESDKIEFTVIYRKDKLPQALSPTSTVGDLKQLLQPIINVPISHQKVIHKGVLADNILLADLKLTKTSKIMVVGASKTETDALLKLEADLKSGKANVNAESEASVKSTSNTDKREHQGLLERVGKPDNVMIGISNRQDPLPPDMCLTGMYDKRGIGIRVRINLDNSELILATKDRTQKIALKTIKEFVHYPLPKHEGYEIVGFQIGSTEKSRIFVYWFPAQYIDAMRDIIMQFKMFGNNDNH